MNTVPEIVDRKALAQHRNRTKDNALFLHRAALDEVQDRLSLVNRRFTSVAIVTPFPQIWKPAFPRARILADGDNLDLGAGHDLILHVMALHWANDPIGQVIQCRRALAKDGLFLGIALGGETLHELRASLAGAETQIRGGLSPRVLPMAEIRDLGGLLQRAGLTLPVADKVRIDTAYRDLFHLMHDLRDMGETNALTSRCRTATSRTLFTLAQQLYHRHFPAKDGRLAATFDLICLTGWSPAADQPQPLRPGSAKTRLAQALGTSEIRLPD